MRARSTALEAMPCAKPNGGNVAGPVIAEYIRTHIHTYRAIPGGKS